MSTMPRGFTPPRYTSATEHLAYISRQRIQHRSPAYSDLQTTERTLHPGSELQGECCASRQGQRIERFLPQRRRHQRHSRCVGCHSKNTRLDGLLRQSFPLQPGTSVQHLTPGFVKVAVSCRGRRRPDSCGLRRNTRSVRP